ncbi:MAG: outer membrane protein assembly factor BamD [Steroidobacteraceae bacterium]
MRSLLLLPLFALMLITGCASDRNGEQQRLAKLEPSVLYKRGQQALRAADYGQAVALYGALTARYPFTPEARQARLDIIYAYYKNGEKESAKDAADTYIRENPTGAKIDYVWYMKGLIDLERGRYAPERWLGVDLSARVPKTATDAFESLRTVVDKFPQSPYAPDARRRMIVVRNRLASYEIQIARHYMQRGAWVAAAQRASQTIDHYDGAPVVSDALRVMIRCYNELGFTDLAQNAEKVFHENFPDQTLAESKSSGSWWKFWGRG